MGARMCRGLPIFSQNSHAAAQCCSRLSGWFVLSLVDVSWFPVVVVACDMFACCMAFSMHSFFCNLNCFLTCLADVPFCWCCFFWFRLCIFLCWFLESRGGGVGSGSARLQSVIFSYQRGAGSAVPLPGRWHVRMHVPAPRGFKGWLRGLYTGPLNSWVTLTWSLCENMPE